MPRHHTCLPSQYRPDGKTKYVKIIIDPISFINIRAREPAIIGSLTILLTPLPPPHQIYWRPRQYFALLSIRKGVPIDQTLIDANAKPCWALR